MKMSSLIYMYFFSVVAVGVGRALQFIAMNVFAYNLCAHSFVDFFFHLFVLTLGSKPRLSCEYLRKCIAQKKKRLILIYHLLSWSSIKRNYFLKWGRNIKCQRFFFSFKLSLIPPSPSRFRNLSLAIVQMVF